MLAFMSTAHIDDLRKALAAHHWNIIGEKPGNDYDIAGVWQIARPDGTNGLSIEFQADIDRCGGPLEKAIACRLAEAPRIGAYFARINRSWSEELSGFMDKLDDMSAEGQP